MKYLFNFSASFTGGGHKRMIEYVKYLNNIGGAIFIINTNCKNDVLQYTNNKYFFVKQNNLKRLFLGERYLNIIVSIYNNIEFYYSYGIPVKKSIGKINWLHISNVLPLTNDEIRLSFYNKIKNLYLGYLIKKSFQIVNYISAESNYSLSLVDLKFKNKLFLSVNGADDEILDTNKIEIKEEIAVVVGTFGYKAINESYIVFKFLQKSNKNLKLIIIGNKKFIPIYILNDKDIIATGLIDRKLVIDYLKKARFYISNTKIENSYNAASEGIFFAEESFISKISVHMELLNNSTYKEINIDGCNIPLLNVKKENLSKNILVNWDKIVKDVLNIIN
jgi:hypothetical protein